MGLAAGKLRHRVVIERPVETQDSDTGAVNVTWQEVATVWAEIAPVSVRDFIAAQTEVSQITTRITIRYRSDVTAKMRVYHAAKKFYYDIQGELSDKNSGLEYLTLACTEGVRYLQGDPPAVIPVNLALPAIAGSPGVGDVVTLSNGWWANDPVNYLYKWYLNGVQISGEVSANLTVPNDVGDVLTGRVIAVNSAGQSVEAISLGATIIL